MSKSREVFLRGQFVTFDRTKAFQLNPPDRKGSKVESDLTLSDQGETSASETDAQSDTIQESGRNLGRIVETNIKEREKRRRRKREEEEEAVPNMFEPDTSLGLSSIGTHGKNIRHRAEAGRKRPTISAVGKIIRNFINSAIDPHVLKILPDNTIMLSNSTLAGACFAQIVNSLTGSKLFTHGEENVLPILLQHATKRIKSLLVPSKRRRQSSGLNVVGNKKKKIQPTTTTTRVIIPADNNRIEHQAGSTALMGFTAPPIQRRPMPSEAKLFAPVVGGTKRKVGRTVLQQERPWYNIAD